jgi:hypothetical protein
MREIDFLPEWYKERKRHQRHVRRQYVILTAAFIAMMGYNLASMHRITRASGELARSEQARVEAENSSHEFNRVTKALNQVRVKADLIERMDSKIDIAAVLAEMSHIIGEPVVLSRLEFTAVSFADKQEASSAGGAGVRAAGKRKEADGGALLENVRFRIVLAGVAASPADVAALVCRLDDSPYFHRVSTSFWRSGHVRSSAAAGRGTPPTAEVSPASQGGDIEVTEFEIVCDLSNYTETNKR